MGKRVRYFQLAAKQGWKVLRHPAENLGLALSVLGLFGLPTTLGLLRGAGFAGLAVGFAVSFVAVLLEGAFQLWRGADERDRVADAFYGAFRSWHDDVEKFLEVREASRPPVPEANLNLSQRLAQIQVRGKSKPPPPDPAEVEAKQAVEAHDRETVSIYIEKYRDQGLKLYDALVHLGVLVDNDNTRQRIRSPKDKYDISHAMHTVWLGAESDLRRYL